MPERRDILDDGTIPARCPMRITLIVAASVLLLTVLPGCLTVETKEVRIKLSDEHSGEATMLFVNIQSETDDSTDASIQDFTELVQSYFQGKQLERDNGGFRNVRKHLFEQDQKLIGEMKLSFDSLSAIRLFKYDRTSPYMMFLGTPSSNELLVETNGTFGGDRMPVIFWPSETREFYVKTRTHPGEGVRRSLLDVFRRWERTGRLPESATEHR
jgi:hypothetical protein